MKKLKRGRIHDCVIICVTIGTGFFFSLEDFAVALMHDCRVTPILIKFKSLIIVPFNFRKARHCISTAFPKI